jgi:hypothetical protein
MTGEESRKLKPGDRVVWQGCGASRIKRAQMPTSVCVGGRREIQAVAPLRTPSNLFSSTKSYSASLAAVPGALRVSMTDGEV